MNNATKLKIPPRRFQDLTDSDCWVKEKIPIPTNEFSACMKFGLGKIIFEIILGKKGLREILNIAPRLSFQLVVLQWLFSYYIER